jgi:hypothetical protein
VRHSQTDADAIVGISIETIGWHVCSADDDQEEV